MKTYATDGAFPSMRYDGLTKREYIATMVFAQLLPKPSDAEAMVNPERYAFAAQVAVRATEILIDKLNNP